MLAALAAAALVLGGCTQAESTSILNADGSVERTVTITVPAGMMPGMETPNPSSFVDFTDDWKTEEFESEESTSLTGTRTISPTAAGVQDYVLDDGQGHQLLCSISVTKEGKRLIYTETYTWQGEKDMDDPTGDVDELLTKHLAVLNPTPAQYESVAAGLRTSLWRALFGPKEPMLFSVMMNPLNGMRQITAMAGNEMYTLLKAEFPSASSADRLKVVRSFFSELQESEGWKSSVSAPTEPPGMVPPGEEEEGGDDTIIQLLTSVSGPSVPISHNGTYDIVSGQVFWSMMSPAPMFEPVVLRAVFEVD